MKNKELTISEILTCIGILLILVGFVATSVALIFTEPSTGAIGWQRITALVGVFAVVVGMCLALICSTH